MEHKFLSAREIEIFRIALHYAELYDRSNPEVGMGPSRYLLALKIADELSFYVREKDLMEICNGHNK